MLSVSRTISPLNFCINKAKLVFCISSKQCLVRHNSLDSRLMLYKVKSKVLNQFGTQQRCGFKTSRPYYTNPVYIICSVFGFGILFKILWHKRSLETKKLIIDRLKRNKFSIYGFLGLLYSFFCVYYVTHLKIDPITKRKRFIMTTEEEQEKISDLTMKWVLSKYKDNLLPRTDHYYKRLGKVLMRLVESNQDLLPIKEKKWSITIIDNEDINVMVLEKGNIIAYKGIFNTIDNDDQIALVLAHEMSHSILKHMSELYSRSTGLVCLLALPSIFCWIYFRFVKVFLSHILLLFSFYIFSMLPHKRAIEKEADDMALIIAAKACYDVREVIIYLRNLKIFTKLKGITEDPTFMSTHPKVEERVKRMIENLPNSLALRNNAGCSRLGPWDKRPLFQKIAEYDNKLHFHHPEMKNSISSISLEI